MTTYHSHSPADTAAIAGAIAAQLRPGDVLALRGGLGAGKTTFTAGLAAALGIADPVSSPTFSLINEYRGEKITLYHFDMYRITDEDSLHSTGYFDYLGGEGLLVIEWSENITEFLPEGAIHISFETTGPDGRIITAEGGDRF